MSRSGRRVIAESISALLTPSLGAERAKITEKCRVGSGILFHYSINLYLEISSYH